MRGLTTREREVVVLRCDGLTVQEIANRLGRSESTVDRTLEKAMRKAGVSNAVMLLRWALQQGVVEVPKPVPHVAFHGATASDRAWSSGGSGTLLANGNLPVG